MLLYHFIDANYGLLNILNRHLKVSRLSQLNDPYELWGVVALESDLKKRLVDLRKYTDETYGIICFSKTWKNPLVWSHYADNHKGICLGFEIEEDSVVKIDYVREPRILTESDLDGKNSKVKSSNILNTKYINWAYEKEYRTFIRHKDCNKIGACNFLDISDEMNLKEIIIGNKSDLNYSSIKRALGEYSSKVEIYASQMSKYKYQIVRSKNQNRKRRRPEDLRPS